MSQATGRNSRWSSSRLTQYFKHLGDVGGDAPGLVAGEQLGRGPSSRLLVEIDEANTTPF